MVRPLTKRKKDGELYVRPKAVEEQIADALREDVETLRQRIRIHDSESPGYLRTECLVNILRETSRAGDDRLVNASLEEILVRCRRMLKTMVSGSLPDAEGVRQSVLDGISIVLARGVAKAATDELDFYECNFFRGFRALNKSIVKKELKRRKQEAEILSMAEIDGHGTGVLKSVTEALQDPEASASRDELLDQLERVLTPDELKAVVLCRVLKVKEESKNPEEITAARLCNCTGRTLRNRLRRADVKLSRFKEGK